MLLAPVTRPDILFLGHTPLSSAIVRRNVAMVDCLLNSGMDPNILLEEGLNSALAVLLDATNFDAEASPKMVKLFFYY